MPEQKKNLLDKAIDALTDRDEKAAAAEAAQKAAVRLHPRIRRVHGRLRGQERDQTLEACGMRRAVGNVRPFHREFI